MSLLLVLLVVLGIPYGLLWLVCIGVATVIAHDARRSWHEKVRRTHAILDVLTVLAFAAGPVVVGTWLLVGVIWCRLLPRIRSGIHIKIKLHDRYMRG